MHKALSYLLLVAAGWFTSACSDAWSSGRPVVARVAGTEITAETFREGYAAYLLKSGQQDSPQFRRAYLDYLVSRELVLRAMRDEGIQEDAGYRHEEEALKRALLVDAYAEHVLFAPIEVTEADLAEMFVRANTKVKARHLYARTEEQANALYERLQQGEPFEALAREVFADPKLAENGGSVGYFGFDDMDPAFEEAAYRLKVGEISGPVRTALGYSIIQVEDRKEAPAVTEADFAKKEAQLRRYVLRRKRTEAMFRHSDELTRELAIAFHPEAVQQLLQQIQGVALMPEGEAARTWLAAPLVSFTSGGREGTWTVADFREHAQYTSDEQRARVASEDDLRGFISGLVVRQEMIHRAEAMGLREDARYHAALSQALDDWIYQAAIGRVRSGVQAPEDSLRAHYEKARDVLTVPEKVRVREILVDTKADAERLKVHFGGRSFEALAGAHSLRPGADASGGDLGYLSREQLGLLAAPVFEAQEGEVVGPLEVAGRYVLLQVGARTPARPMTFEEALPEITASVEHTLATARFADYVASLRDRYEVTVNEAAVSAMAMDG